MSAPTDPVTIFAQLKSNTLKKVEAPKFSKAQLKEFLNALENNNRSLRKLNLSNCNLGDDGAQAIVRVLRKHPSLTCVNLRNNGITQASAKVIEEAVAVNWRLIRVELQESRHMDDINPFLNQEIYNIEPSLREITRICFQNACLKKVLQAKLHRLRVKRRNLVEVPTVLLTASQLQALDLSHNRLTALPAEIQRLPNLEYLLLADNQLAALPPELGLLRRLRKLNVAQNRLTVLPEAVGLLVELRELNVMQNRLTTLPTILGSLKLLERLLCAENPLGGELRDALATGDAGVLAFLRNLFTRGERILSAVKLMFVGDGNVGKTSLLRAFMRGGAPPPEQPTNVATDGIDITRWRPQRTDNASDGSPAPADASDSAPDIEFNAWDFAGQEVYYSTHSFFLSSKALYLVVFNLMRDAEQNRIAYWLRSIASRAGSAPVLLVGTHLDECSKDAARQYHERLRQQFAAQFPNIVGHASVSTVGGKGVSHLRHKLLEIADGQEWSRRKIPQNYYVLLQRVAAARDTQKTPVLPWAAFAQLATDCDVSQADAPLVADLFSHLGELLYFPEHESGLNELVVLDPQWLTRTFATIVSMKNTFTRNGVLPRAALAQLWQPPSYPAAYHSFLLRLLRKFELLYELSDGALLVPVLVDAARDADALQRRWPPGPQLTRAYLFTFVPAGFFARLMVRLMHLSWVAALYWRNGFVVERDGGTDRIWLELQETAETTILRVHVRGPSALQHLHLLADGVNTLAREWLREPLRALVPCPECVARAVAEPHPFALADCEQRLREAPTQPLQCPRSHSTLAATLAPDLALVAFRRIPRAQLHNKRRIGAGGFATVYSAELDGRLVAVKEIELPDVEDEVTEADRLAVYNEFRREAWLMSTLQHPNCVSMYGVVAEKAAIVMELMELGSLYDHLPKPSVQIDWQDRLRWALNIASALQHMHSQQPPIVHRDLKSPNVLLTRDAASQTVVAKVADVGAGGALSLVDAFQERLVSNPVWLAPEIMLKRAYTEKVDVYAFGVILWEMATRRRYFDSVTFMTKIEAMVMRGERPEIPSDVPAAFAALTELCWGADPTLRPTFDAVLRWLVSMQHSLVDVPADLLAALERTRNTRDEYFLKLRAESDRQLKLLQLERAAHSERSKANSKSAGDSRRRQKELLANASNSVANSTSPNSNASGTAPSTGLVVGSNLLSVPLSSSAKISSSNEKKRSGKFSPNSTGSDSDSPSGGVSPSERHASPARSKGTFNAKDSK